jgi:hypothetical protein
LKPAPILTAAILLLGATAVYILIWYLIRAFYRSNKRGTPFAQDQLRTPGQSSGEKINYLNETIGRHAALLLTVPLFSASIYLVHRYFYESEINPLHVKIVVLTGAGCMVYLLVKTLRLGLKRRILRREYEGRIAVGQELNQLVAEGHHVYHDFPAENSNIDHIIVGRSGIFTVETSTRIKPAASNRTDDATVEYNGKILIFPNSEDYNTIAEAERQASWISDWISRTTGEQVAARAIIALPDWFVKRTSADGISVVNPKQFPSLFKHIKPRALTDEMIQRIVHQLELKCRVVKPATQTQDVELQ